MALFADRAGEGRAGGGRQVWTVGALLLAVGDALNARFAAVAVQGELSGFTRAASGHCYFSLKDADGGALVRCAMFRRAATLLDFAPADGQRVELRGRVALYEPRGELQLVVEAMSRAGVGSLYEQFLRLKARLESLGLFDASRKRALARHPRRLGVITSTAGAALHDVLTTLARRSPQVEVLVYPSPVQGADAPEALVRALQTAGERAEVDTLLLVRGGGSLEDLWAFNDERVVRAVAASPIPVVCGVGHETDLSLADLAADLRAPTPTAAAELAAPAAAEARASLAALGTRAMRRVQHVLAIQAQRLDGVTLRLARPGAAVAARSRQLERLSQRGRLALARRTGAEGLRLQRVADHLEHALVDRQARSTARLDALEARLRALDPSQVLGRGYAWLGDAQGRVLTSVRQLTMGDSIEAQLADGVAVLEVQQLKPAASGAAD